MSAPQDAIKKIVQEFKTRIRERVRAFKSDVQTTMHTHDEERMRKIREQIDKQ